MEISEYQVVIHRIQEIEQEQLRYLDYVCNYLDSNIDVQKDNVRDRMLRLQDERNKLNSYINSNFNPKVFTL